MSGFVERHRRLREYRDRMDNPQSPDNLEVRKALLDRVKAGEITLEEAQKQVRALKRKRNAMVRRGEL